MFLRLIGNFCSSIIGLVLGVPLIYYSKNWLDFEQMNSLYSRGLSPRVNARAPSGVSLSSHLKSFTFTFLESSFRNVRLLASGILRAPISSLPPLFKTDPRGTTGTDIARGTPAWYEAQLATVLVQVCLQQLPKAWQSAGKAGLSHLGFEPSTLR